MAEWSFGFWITITEYVSEEQMWQREKLYLCMYEGRKAADFSVGRIDTEVGEGSSSQ